MYFCLSQSQRGPICHACDCYRQCIQCTLGWSDLAGFKNVEDFLCAGFRVYCNSQHFLRSCNKLISSINMWHFASGVPPQFGHGKCWTFLLNRSALLSAYKMSTAWESAIERSAPLLCYDLPIERGAKIPPCSPCSGPGKHQIISSGALSYTK